MLPSLVGAAAALLLPGIPPPPVDASSPPLDLRHSFCARTLFTLPASG